MNKHTDFLLLPLENILQSGVTASMGIGDGIETYPLYDYMMESIFLKMTGFQEQKMKCICWDLATKDYEYIYRKFGRNSLGECSSYGDKNTIYKDLIEIIQKYKHDFIINKSFDKKNVLEDIVLNIDEIFLESNLKIWAQQDFNEYQFI